jgi:hypothetical protein
VAASIVSRENLTQAIAELIPIALVQEDRTLSVTARDNVVYPAGDDEP